MVLRLVGFTIVMETMEVAVEVFGTMGGIPAAQFVITFNIAIG
jgi:hypothetical protein